MAGCFASKRAKCRLSLGLRLAVRLLDHTAPLEFADELLHGLRALVLVADLNSLDD
jgi:hypothetical protein